jgi:hypothetical protein
MDRAVALTQLPDLYAAALRLRDTGLDEEGIGRLLAAPPEAVPRLLGIAEARLRALLRTPAELAVPASEEE